MHCNCSINSLSVKYIVDISTLQPHGYCIEITKLNFLTAAD